MDTLTELQDQEQVCKECGKEFTFTSGEQKFFSDRGLYPPKRCYFCRKKRKAEQKLSDNVSDLKDYRK